MSKIQLGRKYKVTDYSGLDSGRVGTAIKYNQNAYNGIPGIYKPFDSKREIMLQDCNGQYFTMFKNRLILQ